MEDSVEMFSQQDHQVAYLFDPEEEAQNYQQETHLVPLFGGEAAEFVKLRETTFLEAWGNIDQRIQKILRESNTATLDQVCEFVECPSGDQIPAALIVTGPNIASQQLLFEQLAEALQSKFTSRFVRLTSSEATTLKAALKKTIRDVTVVGDRDGGDDGDGDDDDDVQGETTKDGRGYLDYDLEALEACIKPSRCSHVFVAFQDSEGFDSSLLSDLVTLYHSWRPRIPFTLLFGIATSVEFLQTRLLKSACRLMYGGQIDGGQTASTLETVFKGAVAAADVPLRLGASLLRSMLDRQHEQVAGIQSFTSSLKYAYMCHFYANPLSILCCPDVQLNRLQKEHLHAARNLPSFRLTVERQVHENTPESLHRARSLLEDDDYLLGQMRAINSSRRSWADRCLRFLVVLQEAGALRGPFSRTYADGMALGAQRAAEFSSLVQCIRRMDPNDVCGFLHRIIAIFKTGDDLLALGPTENEQDVEVLARLESSLQELEQLRAAAQQEGISLKSSYGGSSKVMRTTVIAQKVQLRQDSAALRSEDKRLTEIIDDITSLLTTCFPDTNPSANLLAECWLYESRSPSREVFVPRPREAFERSLGRPHDYLGFSRPGGANDQGGHSAAAAAAALPAVSLLYQLYLENGSLINVADLWSAFHGIISQEEEDERTILVMFYQSLAELRALGFVKSTKKKADHVAKVKWL